MIGDWTPSSVIGRIKARPEGFKWVAVQQEDTPIEIRAEIIGECHRLGMMCGVWESAVDFGTPAQAAEGFDFYVGQVEGPGQHARLAASLAAFRAAHPDMPAACVTNTGGFESEPGITPAQKARPFIDAGFACIAESHVKEEGGDHTEARLDYIQRVLQWPAPQPMAGLGMGATLSDYPTLRNHAGWSVFAAEELI